MKRNHYYDRVSESAPTNPGCRQRFKEHPHCISCDACFDSGQDHATVCKRPVGRRWY